MDGVLVSNHAGRQLDGALALGAAAVCVGRPWVYGMAIAGEDGAREALRNLVAEFDLTLALSGHRSVAELDVDVLVRD